MMKTHTNPTKSLHRLVLAVALAAPVSAFADGAGTAGLVDNEVARYASGETLWCPALEIEVPEELYNQIGCGEGTNLVRSAVAGARVTRTTPRGLGDFLRGLFGPPRTRIVVVSPDDGEPIFSFTRPTGGGNDSPSPSGPVVSPTDRDSGSDAPKPKPSTPVSGSEKPTPSSPKDNGTRDNPRGKPDNPGRSASRKGDNGWGNGPDTTNAGSFSGGTRSSKSTNGSQRNDKNYSTSLNKFEGR